MDRIDKTSGMPPMTDAQWPIPNVPSAGQVVGSPRGRPRRSSPSSHAPSEDDQTPSTTNPKPPTHPPQKKKRIRLKTERRREQCRRNQARYRIKQKAASLELETAVQELYDAIVELQERRRALHHTMVYRNGPVLAVREFFRLFGRGLSTSYVSPMGSSGVLAQPYQGEQFGFISNTVSLNVRVVDVFGRDQFTSQLRRYSTYFDDYLLDLQSVSLTFEDDNESSVMVTSTIAITITSSTIRFVFPHLGDADDPILQKILGGRFLCPVSAVFVFNERNQIIGVDWTVDFISALLTTLTIEETAIVLGQAHIARDALLTRCDEDRTATISRPEFQDEVGRTTAVVPTSNGRAVTESGSHRNARVLVDDDGEILLHDGQGDDFVMV